MNNSRKKRILFVVLGIAIVAVGSYLIKTDLKDKKLAEHPAAGPVIVDLSPVEQKDWGTVIKSVGTVQSFSGVTLRAQIAGRVTAVNAKSGSSVASGTAILEINPQILLAQLGEDKAELKLTEFEYQRQLKLYEEKVISLETLTEAKSKYQIDQATVAATQQKLDLATSRAEFNGQLGLIKVEVGDEVAVGQELATLQFTDRLRVEFAIPQKYAQLVTLGDAVSITAAVAGDSKDHNGKVYAIEPLVDEATRTVSVRAEVPPEDFVPDSYAEVSLMLDDRKPVIMVPQTAVMLSLYGDSVYKVVDGKAKQTTVTLGPRQGSTVIVSEGLSRGDTIVSAGLRKVTDGAAVVAPVAKPAAGKPANNNSADKDGAAQS